MNAAVTFMKPVLLRILTGFVLAIVLSAFFSGCGGGGGGGGGGGNPTTPPPDLRGVWAGTWTGNSATQGLVTGTWEAEIADQFQGDVTNDPEGFSFSLGLNNPSFTNYWSDTRITGMASLRGDIDCMDGDLEGLVDAHTQDFSILHQIVGLLSRTVCGTNEWNLTALDLSDRTTSGVWSKRSSPDTGTFTGTRIALLNGPRIRYFNPPSGKEGALVTIAGDNFSSSLPDDVLAFDSDPTPALAATTTTLTTRVPGGVSTGPVVLTTPEGSATSPVAFVRDVTFPILLSTSTIATGNLPESIAVSPDGRKVYVAHPASGTRVSLINTANDIVLINKFIATVKNFVVSPDGRWVYVTTASESILALDAAILTSNSADEITVSIGGVPIPLGTGAEPTPNGLAMSPDGRYLYATQNEDAGVVVVVDIATKGVVTTVSKGAGATPVGVAAHPDGRSAYFAYSGYGIVAFDTETMAVVDVTGPNSSPSGLLVTPDGKKLYVADTLANSVDVFDAVTNTWVKSIAVGLTPTGLAISPDGSRVYVVNNGGNTVSVIRVVGDLVLDAPIAVGNSPVSIAIAPNGRMAYVTNAGSANVSTIGGSLTLTIAKIGSGTGTVASNPSGIFCGTVCQSKFSPFTPVTLSADPGSGSTFQGWTGDADCADGQVTINANMSCTAEFRAIPKSSGGSGIDGSKCFIATAAYGSGMANDVVLLRRFRDEHLLTNALGELFVELYYQHSPPAAQFLTQHEHMRTAVRWGLQPIVLTIKYPGAGAALASILFCAFVGIRIGNLRKASRVKGSSNGVKKLL